MISLRKHIEAFARPAAAAREETTAVAVAEPTDPSAVSALCTVIDAVGESGQRAVPALGDELIRNMGLIQAAFTRLENPATLEVTSARVKAELGRWADRAFQHHADNERDMKEIINVVARATETVGERDKKYATQIGDLSRRLGALTDLDDLPLIRRSILESTRALKACVEKMAEDSRESMSKLVEEVAEYRTKLAESERVSITDELTHLGNRRAFETELETRITGRQTFSLIMIDLNGFKAVNDCYGHLAGDDLLRQFAGELTLQFTPGDIVARWGGDEFAALVYGELTAAESRVERVRRWALGEYKLTVEGQKVKVRLDAAIGAVSWDGKEHGATLLARADKRLYADKGQNRVRELTT
jgi:diguanylate cyclase (GGDEF)-like protein